MTDTIYNPPIKLDRLYELDWRSLNYPVTALPEMHPDKTYRPRSYTWACDQWLDQGPDGACVGFAWAHELIARPQSVIGVGYYQAMEYYRQAQRIDPWPGEDYEGTSVLAGAKILRGRGFYNSFWWALNAEEVAKTVAFWGPGVLGINWYEGMFYPDRENFIRPSGRLAGGHAILIHSVKIVYKRWSWLGWWKRTWRDVDFDRSYVVLHNSWGRSWGKEGRAKLSLADLDRLLAENGEACFPARNYDITEESHG